MTLINDQSDTEPTLISNKLLNSEILKLPNAPVEFLQISFEKCFEEQDNVEYPFAASQVYKTSINSAKLLTSGKDVNCILEVELYNKTCLKFEPGDTIGILPKNTTEEVNFIINHLNLQDVADQTITISSIKSNKTIPNFIPKCGSIRHILTWCLNIRCIPKKMLLRCLSKYTSNPEEKLRLEQLSSIQGKDDYSQFILKYETTLIDIFKSFSSCKPSFERLLEHLPRLTPRPYSICSSPLDKLSLKIVLSIAKYKHDLFGICSGYIYELAQQKLNIEKLLENLVLNHENNTEISFYLRHPTNFHLPNDNTTPVIMIGTGTGISPFIGFLNHRRKQLESDSTLKFGEMWLFYGCRYSNRDFIFKDDLNIMLDNHILSKMYVSFSRENNGQQYVQDNLKLYRKDLFHLIYHQNAVVYICGDKKKMGVDVKKEILNIIQSVGEISENEATDFMEMLVKFQRYVEDIWQ